MLSLPMSDNKTPCPKSQRISANARAGSGMGPACFVARSQSRRPSKHAALVWAAQALHRASIREGDPTRTSVRGVRTRTLAPGEKPILFASPSLASASGREWVLPVLPTVPHYCKVPKTPYQDLLSKSGKSLLGTPLPLLPDAHSLRIGTQMTRMRRISADQTKSRSALIRCIRVIRVPVGATEARPSFGFFHRIS
jgi:hypothetical protein